MLSSLAPSSLAVVLAVFGISENTPENGFLRVVCIKFMRVFRVKIGGKNAPFCTQKILINYAVSPSPFKIFKLPLGVRCSHLRRGKG